MFIVYNFLIINKYNCDFSIPQLLDDIIYSLVNCICLNS